MDKKPAPKSPGDIIDALGGTRKTARLCCVTDAAVTNWRTAGIPPARQMFIELARPDVFGAKPKRIKAHQTTT